MEKFQIVSLDSLLSMRLPIQIEAILFKRTNGKIQYLLLKTIPRRTPRRGEYWQPITGGLEEGETKVEALKREVREETGIRNTIKIIEDVHHYEFQDLNFLDYLNKQGHECKNLTEYAFGVEVSPKEIVALDGKEHSEFKWCDYEEALRLLKWKGNKDALKRLDKILSAQE